MAEKTSLLIEIVSDVVCPWCFIGLRRLDKALALVNEQYPDTHCTPSWRPFFLNPDSPPEGEPYLPFLVRKFGSLEKVQGIFQRVRDAGADYGLEYCFEKIQVRANTLKAHRLIHWAQQQGDPRPLVERLFVGQFQRGENVSDIGALVNIAGECGFDQATVASFLASDEDETLVLEMEKESRSWGVNVVPTFVVGRKLIIPGAEDPQILADAIVNHLRMT